MSADSRIADAVIIGAGPAGAALAAVLARHGFEVLVLERNRLDDPSANRRVLRGEWIAPWGVEQLLALGLYSTLSTKGQIIASHVRCEDGGNETLDLAGLIANVPGPLGIEYDRLCAALREQASRAGAQVIDGFRLTKVSLGPPSTVTFSKGGCESTVAARVIVGADGRASATRKKLSIPVRTAHLHHYVCGVLLDDLPAWQEDREVHVIGDTASFLVSGVGRGRFRVYLYFDPETFRAAGLQRLDDLCHRTLVSAEEAGVNSLADCRWVGPCLSMPNAASWVEVPCRHPLPCLLRLPVPALLLRQDRRPGSSRSCAPAR